MLLSPGLKFAENRRRRVTLYPEVARSLIRKIEERKKKKRVIWKKECERHRERRGASLHLEVLILEAGTREKCVSAREREGSRSAVGKKSEKK